jgi:hypothetical protein
MKTQKFKKVLICVITAVVFLLSTNIVQAMYDPQMMRFTSRDPVKGEYKEPLTLHKYLYCLNEPINRADPAGRFSARAIAAPVVAGYATHDLAIGFAAVAVAINSDKLLDFAIGMESSIAGVMSAVAAGWNAIDAIVNQSVTYTDHMNDLVSLNEELRGLEGQLQGSKSPKDRDKLKELIEKIRNKIDGKVKEMKQKWPDKIQ